MDGNRRYGRSRYSASAGSSDDPAAPPSSCGIPSGYLRGHHDGGLKLVDFIGWCIAAGGYTHLTVYAFSTENYSRPQGELRALHGIFMTFCSKILAKCEEWDLKVQVHSSDGMAGMPKDVVEAFSSVVAGTKHNKGLVLNVCVGYTGRDEIVNAAKGLVGDVLEGTLEKGDVDNMTAEDFEQYLEGGARSKSNPSRLPFDGPEPSPPLDAVLRTSGEMRLSGFQLWQSAYSELFFLNKTWPEVTEDDLRRVNEEFEARERRFGR